MDDLGLVETIDRLGESVVITVADVANRRLDAIQSPAWTDGGQRSGEKFISDKVDESTAFDKNADGILRGAAWSRQVFENITTPLKIEARLRK
jgi:hypothetical protein